MKSLFSALLLFLALSSAKGQNTSSTLPDTGEGTNTSAKQSQTILLNPAYNRNNSVLSAPEEENEGSSVPYLLFKASFNSSILRSTDKKLPLARLEVEAPVHKEVIHLGFLVMPLVVQHTPDDSEFRVLGGLSAGIHFPFNKVIDPNNRTSLSDIKPFMRGYAALSIGESDDEAENSNRESSWLFYSAYDLGVDWALLQLGDSRLGLSAFSTNLKYWNFGLVLKFQ